MITRRKIIGASAASAGLAVAPAIAAPSKLPKFDSDFPKDFIWGAATAGHQIEGNNVNSDLWLLEHMKPSVFAEPSGDAVNSFALWRDDLDLVKAMGLNSYRFSLEWARIEPEPDFFSIAMLDHYKAIIEGCLERGLAPIVTFNHFTSPRWFAAMGGWTNAEAPKIFARYCDRAARHLVDGIDHVITFNEPNILRLLRINGLPPFIIDKQRAMLDAAAKQLGVSKYSTLNAANWEDLDRMLPNLLDGHRLGKAAIKAAKTDVPVGVSLALFDDQAAGKNSLRNAKRHENYGAWLDTAKSDDFVGVQNYERVIWGSEGKIPTPVGGPRNFSGAEVYAASLAGAVRYAHQATGVPVLVTEHGVGTDDDTVRAAFIPAALKELKHAINDGVPVKGYVHWSLLDNFEWIFGYGPKFGLHSVDRTTFKRTAKPSAAVLGAIARRNGL